MIKTRLIINQFYNHLITQYTERISPNIRVSAEEELNKVK